MAETLKIQLSDSQAAIVLTCLRAGVAMVNEKAELATRKGFHDAAEERQFYVDLQSRYEEVIASIAGQVAGQTNGGDEDDEDVCHECGEDEGFCQCED